MADALKALSVRQPWAHAIIHLGKTVENRSRCTSHRGTTLIHASAGMTTEEYEDATAFMHALSRLGGVVQGPIPSRAVLDRGGIIGVCEIVDCVGESGDPWYMGASAYVIANPRPLPFIPCKGTMMPLFWTPDDGVQLRVRQALGLGAQ